MGLIDPVLPGHLEKGDGSVVPSHKQQAKGPGTAIAGNGGGGFLQVDPFEGAVLLDKVLDQLEKIARANV